MADKLLKRREKKVDKKALLSMDWFHSAQQDK
jgi:hypothetical protein